MNAKQAGMKYTKKSLEAFLRGEKNEKWALGIMGASTLEAIKQSLEALSFYSNTERYRFLVRAVQV